MRQWLAAALLLVTILAVGCLRPSRSPQLLSPPDGMRVEVFESHVLELSEQGRSEFLVKTSDIAISAVSLATRDGGGPASVEVARLSGQPASLSPPPALDTYQFFEIAVADLADSNIESVTITFDVLQAWLDSHGYEEGDIALQRFSDIWEALPTRPIGRNGEDVQYEAVSPGLSLFAVTADRPNVIREISV